MSKLWKTIDQENSTIKIYGDDEYIEIDYKIPEWEKDKPEDEQEFEACFEHEGNTYFLSEIMRVEKNAPEWMQEFSGYSSQTYFSGIMVKMSDCGDGVKVYTYTS